MKPKTFSSRSATESVSSSSCFSAILSDEMRGDGVGELRRVLDLVDRDQHLGRDLLVELDVLLELRDHRARQRLDLARPRPCARRPARRRPGRSRAFSAKPRDARALAALDQHLHGAVGQLQQLQHRGDGADRVDVVRRGIVLRRVLLRDEQDLLVVLHHVFERAHGLLAADEERHDHVREHDDVAQRQDRKSDTLEPLVTIALRARLPAPHGRIRAVL